MMADELAEGGKDGGEGDGDLCVPRASAIRNASGSQTLILSLILIDLG